MEIKSINKQRILKGSLAAHVKWEITIIRRLRHLHIIGIYRVLNPDDSFPISVPTSWSGRIWGRTLCSQDSTRKLTSLTGDCGFGAVECSGSGAQPPATLAEFTLNGTSGLDFYDVSLVDGYNLPMLVVLQGSAGGNYSNTGCVSDLNESCPSELKVVSTVRTSSGGGGECMACKSACEAFGDPKYCCNGG